jgi:hypothetical protein
MITFDPELHEYRDDGRIIRSVTQILKGAGIIDDRWYTEEARERGSAVHYFCEQYAQGKRFDDYGRTLASLEYVNAFVRWMSDYHVYALATEQIIYNSINGREYVGKYDLFALIDGKKVLVDYKTGPKASWHKIQISAYALALNPQRSMLLYLKRDGRYAQDYVAPTEYVSNIRRFRQALGSQVLAENEII